MNVVRTELIQFRPSMFYSFGTLLCEVSIEFTVHKIKDESVFHFWSFAK